MKNYYDVLGINQDASKEQVREAYKKLSARIHPDKNDGDNYFSELFKNINEANQILSDHHKRTEYDFKLNKFQSKNITWQFHNEHKQNAPGAKAKKIQQAKKLLMVVLGAASIVGLGGLIFLFISIAQEDSLQAVSKSDLAGVINIEGLKNDSIITEAKVATPPVPGIVKTLEEKEAAHEQFATAASTDLEKELAPTRYIDPLPKFANEKEKPATSNDYKNRASELAGNRPMPVDNAGAKVLPEKSVLPMQMSETQQAEILNTVVNKRINLGSSVNCVRILKTKNSNVENAFEVAAYLKNKGFVIAGRETINKQVQGTQVNITPNFIIVTIGSY